MRVLACFIIFVSICISSCSSSGEEFSSINEDFSGKDEVREVVSCNMQQEYNMGLYNKMCEIDGIYYFIVMQWIHYYDTKTEQWEVLCGKPECMHDDTSCNGYVDDPYILLAYDDALYSISHSKGETWLCRVSKDGARRENVRSIHDLSGRNGLVMLHRGYAYSSVCTERVIDGKTVEVFRMYQYDLEGEGDGELIFEQEYAYVDMVHYQMSGDKIYLGIQYAEGEKHPLELYIYDISKSEWEKEWSGETSGRIVNFLVEGPVIDFTITDTFHSEKGSGWMKYNCDSKTIEEKYVTDIVGGAYLSQEYITIANVKGVPGTYLVMDHEGKVLDEGMALKGYAADERMIIFQYIGEKNGQIFFLWSDTSQGIDSDYYILSWTEDGMRILGKSG